MGLGASIGGATGGSAGAAAGLAEVSNNYLKHDEIEKYWKAVKGCANGDPSACQTRDSLERLSEKRDVELVSCVGNAGAGCNQIRQKVRNSAADIIRLGLDFDAQSQITIGKADSTFSSIDKVGAHFKA